MRVAFIGGFAFTPKGTMRARAHPLAAELVRAGHEVSLFLTPYDNLVDCDREWESEGVRIRNVGAAASSRSPGFAQRAMFHAKMLRQLIREVSRYCPDVIHVFKPKGFAGAAGTYFLLRAHPPVVLDCDDWEGWGGWNEIKQYPWLVKECIDRQERWLVRRAHAVTAASRSLASRATHLRRSRPGVFYIPNCGASTAGQTVQQTVLALDRDLLRREFGFDHRPVVLYSGHFEDQNSVAFFCKAAATVLQRHSARLVVLGGNVPEEAVRMQFTGMPDVQLHFFSRLDYAEFLRLVLACDVAAFPYPDGAIHRAKCSARITDYMAMGRAVLTSAVGQNLEYIVDGESGLLAAPDDAHDFAAKLSLLLDDDQLRTALGSNAIRRVRQNFIWGREAAQCLAAYDYALGRKEPTSPRPAGEAVEQCDRNAA